MNTAKALPAKHATAATKPTKNKVGRPTKYRPWMCDRVIALMAQGASKHEALADLGIWEDTFYRWAKEIPEFSEAVKIGTELSRMWWEREGRQSLRDKDFNHGLWYMNMKNRFGWTDRVNTTNSSPTSISVTFVASPVPKQVVVMELVGPGVLLPQFFLQALCQGYSYPRYPYLQQLS